MLSKKASFIIMILLTAILGGLLCIKEIRTSEGTKIFNDQFAGEGTLEEPYLINSLDDIRMLRDLVNLGYKCDGLFFAQTTDIDLEEEMWVPIGSGDSYFNGVYDGRGHLISNFGIECERAALFDHMEGVIANIRMSNADIRGSMVASFVIEAKDEDAAILNCVSEAKLSGNIVAGIAYIFKNGVIACNIDMSSTDDECEAYGVIADGFNVKIYSNFSDKKTLFPKNVQSNTSVSCNPLELVEIVGKKINVREGLAQYLFANKYDVSLVEYEISGAQIGVNENNYAIVLLGIINYFLLPLLLWIYIIIRFVKNEVVDVNSWNGYRKRIISELLISGIVVFFFDVAFLYRRHFYSFGAMLFAVAIHYIFFNAGILVGKYETNKILSNIKNIKNHWCLVVVILICMISELAQFENVPHYDATLYYGSLVDGTNAFYLDLFSYIGGFACWKWIQGLVLFLAPFEYILNGEIIGVYLANMLITIVTCIVLYRLLADIYPLIPKYIIAITCLIFNFLPYQMGLFSYLCMDYHLSFFAIWLIYCAYKKNDLMICFCGYLLCFTKITGAVYYVAIMLIIGMYEIISSEGDDFIKKFQKWFQFKKVVLWIAPAVLFFVSFIWGRYLEIQNFYGTYNADKIIKLKTGEYLYNTLSQAGVFGFRWLFILLFICALFKNRFLKKKKELTVNNKICVWAAWGGSLLVLVMLLLYNADAACPRYTAIMNVGYILIIPWIIDTIIERNIGQYVVISLLSVIFVVQNYYNIDPTYMFSNSINLGKVALKSPTVHGSKSGLYYEDREFIGDYYVYNYEHTCYDSVLDDIFSDDTFEPDLAICVLDIAEYELQISGSYNRNYKIYWNTRQKRRTYNKEDIDSKYLNVLTMSSNKVINEGNDQWIPERFYLLVTPRVNPEKMYSYLDSKGYKSTNVISGENWYTSISLIEYSR